MQSVPVSFRSAAQVTKHYAERPGLDTKIALLVMGVGRSGTSALTRVLNLLGADLPRNIMGPSPANERGHWEPNRIVALSDEMLRLHSSDWFDPGPFPRGWFASQQAKSFVHRAAAMLENEYKGRPFILIKDPRICRLAPIYMAALDRIGYSPRVVITLRHPIEVVESLRRRDGTDPIVSELIWIRHILEMEVSTRNYPRTWTSYDSLLEDWHCVQARIAAQLNVAWPNSPREVDEDVVAFLEPDLRHFDARWGRHSNAIGSLASKLWGLAQLGLDNQESALRAGFDRIRLIVDEMDRLAMRRLEADHAATKRELAVLKLRLGRFRYRMVDTVARVFGKIPYARSAARLGANAITRLVRRPAQS